MVLAQSEMKCEAGKCATDKSAMKKDLPTIKPAISQKPAISKKDTSLKKEKPVRTQKVTIEQLFNVKTIKVKKMMTAQEQVNYGYIMAQDSLKVDVTAWYSGFVEVLYADTLYKKVKKGEALAKVYSPEVYKAKQDYLNSINYNATRPAAGMLKSAKTKLTLLGISPLEITRIQKEGKADEFTTIYAPVSGWIFEKNINQGSSFTSKKKLFQIVNLDKVWMEVKLFQNEVEKLKTLEHFTVKPKGTDKTYVAKKSLLYPMIDPKEATVTLRLTLNNDKGDLKPGMYAKMHASAGKQSHLVIPRTAAMRKNGIWYAFLATEFKGEYEPVIIELKPLDNTHYEVLKGLHDGDTLVNNALFMMDSDAQINGVY
jgi:Cu(I)/Ag(I) efflux system membrane fusion protein